MTQPNLQSGKISASMLAEGTRLGPYEILAPLGAGGMGEVYRALDTRLDRQVAIKVLPRHFAFDSDRLARFEREAKSVAALSHPNVLVIHDFSITGDVPFAVTELLEGETLRQLIARSALPWRRVVEIAAAITSGLTAVHARGILHRDLKPENLFLTADGRVKILDFGLARMDPPAAPACAETGEYQSSAETGDYHFPETDPGTVVGTVG